MRIVGVMLGMIAIIMCGFGIQIFQPLVSKKMEIIVDAGSRQYPVTVMPDETLHGILKRLDLNHEQFKSIPEDIVFFDGQVIRLEPNLACISLNEASREQLMQIKGIGPRKAEAIVQYRVYHHGFRAVEELVNIKGIGPKIFERVKHSVCI